MADYGNAIIVDDRGLNISEQENGAGGAIYPGMLIDQGTTGTFAASTNTTGTFDAIAIPDCTLGMDITEAYASGEHLTFFKPVHGCQARLYIPASTTITQYADVYQDGAGGAASTGTTAIGKALEAKATESDETDVVLVEIY